MESVAGDSSGPSTRCWRRRSVRSGVGGGGGRWSRGRSRFAAGLSRSVLAGALGLKSGGVEDTVATDCAHRESLGVILKRVGRRLRALVNHGQLATLGRVGVVAFKFVENEGDVRAFLLDGTGFDEAL